MKFIPDPKQFLGMNVDSPDGRDGDVYVSVRAYLEKISKEVLPKPLEQYAKQSTPCPAWAARGIRER